MEARVGPLKPGTYKVRVEVKARWGSFSRVFFSEALVEAVEPRAELKVIGVSAPSEVLGGDSVAVVIKLANTGRVPVKVVVKSPFDDRVEQVLLNMWRSPPLSLFTARASSGPPGPSSLRL